MVNIFVSIYLYLFFFFIGTPRSHLQIYFEFSKSNSSILLNMFSKQM